MNKPKIKVRFFSMHMGRSADPFDPQSIAEDKAYMESFNYGYTPTRDYTWKDIQLTCGKDYDYAVVIDAIFKQNYFDPSRTILFRMEPALLRSWFPEYNQAVDASQFMKVYDFNNLMGWLQAGSYNDLMNMKCEKTEILSTITSANNATYGHKNRLNFIPHLNSLGSDIFHFYGSERGNYGLFSKYETYKGELQSKMPGIKPYKYHFAAENSYEENYFSEKLTDAILMESLPFYCGCLNIFDYFKKESVIILDLSDPEKSLYIINESIKNNEWEKRIDIIKEEKYKLLTELNILNVVNNTLTGKKNYFEK